jgi:hypothetical protein
VNQDEEQPLIRVTIVDPVTVGGSCLEHNINDLAERKGMRLRT